MTLALLTRVKGNVPQNSMGCQWLQQQQQQHEQQQQQLVVTS